MDIEESSMSTVQSTVLEMHDVCKTFYGEGVEIIANDHINFTLKQGEIHALLVHSKNSSFFEVRGDKVANSIRHYHNLILKTVSFI